ncbi:MAG: hypothetical protein J7M21_01375 [Planctomycetes bacterium]|nr:hypothetical protein [Planctomycetota bacterium]
MIAMAKPSLVSWGTLKPAKESRGIHRPMKARRIVESWPSGRNGQRRAEISGIRCAGGGGVDRQPENRTAKIGVECMTILNEREIIRFVKSNIEPIRGSTKGDRLYRCSATLRDGVYLPCVVLRPAHPYLESVIRGFDRTRNDKKLHKSVGYRSTVKLFVCGGNRVNIEDIAKVELSPYAVPRAIMKEIYAHGETSMGYTIFTAIMDDGQTFNFIIGFEAMFLDMPENYTGDRIAKVVVHKRENPDRLQAVGVTYGNRPYFNCFVDKI